MPKGDNNKGKSFGKPFPENNPNMGGRKKSIINQVWTILVGDIETDREIALSKEDKFRFIEMILELPVPKLKEIANNNKNLPVFMLNIITAVMADVQEGRTNTIDKYFDRFYGKASNTVDVTSNGESLASVPDWVRQKKE